MKSKIFVGHVEHTRLLPVHHQLKYRVYVYGIDLSELEALDRRLPLFGYNRFRPTAINDRDYLDPRTERISDKLRRWVESEVPGASIRRMILVTSPRYFNYVFNPVSFYYCYDADERLIAAVTEVNNTFGERHVYVLPTQNGRHYPARFEAEKRFHVSPFNTVTGRYHFSFSDIRKELDINIELWRNRERTFHAKLRGRPLALTPLNHLKTLVTHPLIPHLTIPRIYWQAARLKFQKHLTYHPKPVPVSSRTIRKNPPTPIQRQCMRFLLKALESATKGRLLLRLPGGRPFDFGDLSEKKPVQLRINDYRFFSRVVKGGDIGFGEAFMAKEWDSDDVTGVVRFFIRNRDTIRDGQFRSTLPAKAVDAVMHFARRNTLVGSRRNIRRHYDLSNAFFETFLDDTLAYSCGIFEHPADSLETAQRNKLHRLMDMARIGPEDHVLEIGCGWGAFAVEAVRRTGCRVTGITVSKAQYDYTLERVRRAGLSDRIEIRLEDYRRVQGRFDKIVSIEMLEAVGHKYFGTFFNCCDRLLKTDGLMALQVITIPDQHYDRYRKECDWIQKHIFPGGLLPSLTVLTQAMTDRSSLMVEKAENIGIHYARTLRRWRKRFKSNEDRVIRLGFDDTFRRKWIYYLASCEAGFAERVLGNLQMLVTREGNRRLPSDAPR